MNLKRIADIVDILRNKQNPSMFRVFDMAHIIGSPVSVANKKTNFQMLTEGDNFVASMPPHFHVFSPNKSNSEHFIRLTLDGKFYPETKEEKRNGCDPFFDSAFFQEVLSWLKEKPKVDISRYKTQVDDINWINTNQKLVLVMWYNYNADYRNQVKLPPEEYVLPELRCF